MKEIELINKRKKREKHFLREDGTIIAKLYNDDVHFKKNGIYEEIDNRLIIKDNEYINKNNSFKTIFNDKFLLQLFENNNYLKIKLKDKRSNRIKKIKSTSKLKSTIYFEEIIKNIDFRYALFSNKIKENIIIKEKLENLDNLIFEVNTNLQLRQIDDEYIVAEKNGEIMYYFEPLFMIDSNNNKCINIRYCLNKKNDNCYHLSLNVDYDWLNDAKRKYPIIIDPTISRYSSETGVIDTYIQSGNPNYNTSFKDYVEVGNFYYDNTDHISRTLLKFELPQLETGSQILDAKVTLIGYPIEGILASEAYQFLEVHRLTSDWQESTVTWNNMSNNFDSRVEGVFEAVRSTSYNNEIEYVENNINITDLVKKWYMDLPNYGIMIKAVDETDRRDFYPKFFSKENDVSGESPHPTLQITYRNINGLEDYIKTFDHKYTIGKASVNSFNGNLTSSFMLIDSKYGPFPFSLSLFYNTNDVVCNKNYGIGKGYKFNFYQTIEVFETDTFTKYLKYMDEDGTYHYFSKQYEYIDNNGEIAEIDEKDIYYDEDGLGFKIKEFEDRYELYDKENNIETFTINNNIGYLTKIENLSAELNILYDSSNRLIKITESDSNELNISYLSNQIIITYNNETVYLNISDNKVNSIVTSDGTTNIVYNSNNIIDNILDVNNKKVMFEYYNKFPFKIKKVTNYDKNNNIINYYNLDYGFNSTILTDDNLRKIFLVFNNNGNIVSSELLKTENNINDSYGIGNIFGDYYQYTNRLISSGVPIRYVKNYLKNTSFESNENYFLSDNCTLNITDEEANSGYKSLKITSLNVNDKAYQNNIIVPKNDYYTFSCYLKSNCRTIISLSYEENNEIIESNSEIIYPNSIFSREDVTIFYPDTASSNINIKIKLLDIGDCYIDDIQLEKGRVDNNYNYIENSDFSDGLTDWNTSDNSSFSVVNINNLFNALKISMNPCNPTSIYKEFNLKGHAGDLFTISFWYKNEGVCLNDIDMGYNHVIIKFEPDVEEPEFNEENDKELIDYPMFHCVFPSDNLNPNREEWQYFTYTFMAEDFDYKSVSLSFNQQYDANNLYITNLCLYKDIRTESFEYDEDGNHISTTKANLEDYKFDIDRNNKLLGITNPKNNKLSFEYIDNNLFKTSSMEKISTFYNYNEYGKNDIVKVENRNDYTNLDNNMFRIRIPNSKNYFKIIMNRVNISNVKVPDAWYFIPEIINNAKYYKIKHSILNLFLNTNNDYLSLSNASFGLFELITTDGIEYIIKEKESEKCLTLENDTLCFKLEENITQNYKYCLETSTSSQFYEYHIKYSSDCKHVIEEEDEMLRLKRNTFGSNDLISNVNDYSGNKEYIYDIKDRLISYTNNNKTIEYEYNIDNQLSKVSNGTKNFHLVYDSAFRKTGIIGNNNTPIINYEYNTQGHISRLLFPNNQYIKYYYDEFGRIVRKTKDNDLTDYNYLYDSNGNLARVICGDRTIKIKYDLAKRLSKYINNDFAIDYVYDENNCLVSKKFKIANEVNIVNTEVDKDNNIKKCSFDQNEITNNYDSLGRIISSSYNGSFEVNRQYLNNGKRTSTVLKKLKNGNNEILYNYDNRGNIRLIYNNGVLTNKYIYDDILQLVKEYDYVSNRVIDYKYDSYGNILCEKVCSIYDYSLLERHKYIYEYENSFNKLIKYDNSTITYDSFGNITAIGNKEFSWSNGRELNSYSDGNNFVEYNYNDNSVRTSKIVNNIKTNYYLDGDKIAIEKSNNYMIYYIRDINKNLIGFKYNNNTYYYLKNGQNDIISIMDINNNILANYKYDSWGKLLAIYDSNGIDVTNNTSHIGNINPFRYKSYYYDIESGLYYLKNRYYNPNLRRYINIDSRLNDTILGTNLYSYCENNPISREDEDGTSWWHVGCVLVGGIVGAAIKISKNLKDSDKNWYDDVAGAFVSGAIIGACFSVNPDLTIGGALLAGYSGEAVNEIESYVKKDKNGNKKKPTKKNIQKSVASVLVKGTLSGLNNYICSQVANDLVPVKGSWFKPTKFMSVFTGNYGKKMIAQTVISSVQADMNSTIYEDITDYLIDRVVDILPDLEDITPYLIILNEG